MDTKKVWFVTGASKGLGLSLVKKLTESGYRVAATSRKVQNLTDAVGTFDEKQFLPLEVDLTSEKSISEAVEKTIAHFGKIDVLVNNAGYGIGGAVEELNQQEIKDSFDVNVFAVIGTMQAVMPHFRAQKSGNIINISSIAGFAPGNRLGHVCGNQICRHGAFGSHGRGCKGVWRKGYGSGTRSFPDRVPSGYFPCFC
ncbi:UNVERIFIED_CONTAM: NADP-dependent 3-hydroxy acid dehydrogenase YdfG [Pseudacidovorax intermedius]|nr:NADP-dependent 3-hydroxy acid dehydrogenase YdfG [Pseudacidovorax intermedius]